MDDAQIRKIVGSRASWMMRWGMLWAFGVFLCIYCVMYGYAYPYEKEVKGIVHLAQPRNRIVRFYISDSGNLRRKEVLLADSIKIGYHGRKLISVPVRRVIPSKTGYCLEFIDSAAFTYKAPFAIEASLKITGMNLLDIVFKDVGASVQRK